MNKWLVTLASLALAIVLAGCQSEQAVGQDDEQDQKKEPVQQDDNDTHKDDSTKKQDENQSQNENDSENKDQTKTVTVEEQNKEEAKTENNDENKSKELSAATIKEQISLGMPIKKVISFLGEPNQKVVDSFSGDPMYRFDRKTVDSYSYEDPFEGDSIDMDGLQNKDVQLIVMVGYKNNKVTSYQIYYYDEQGNLKNYRKNKEFEKTDDIQF